MGGTKKHQRDEYNTIGRNLKWLWCGRNNMTAGCVWSRCGPPAPHCLHTTTWNTIECAARLQHAAHVLSHAWPHSNTKHRVCKVLIKLDVKTIKVTLTETDKMMAEPLTNDANNRAAANIKETSDWHYYIWLSTYRTARRHRVSAVITSRDIITSFHCYAPAISR